MGRFTAVAGGGDRGRARLVERLAARGYDVRETAHLAVGVRPSGRDACVIVHGFDEVTIDEDVPQLLAEELGPLGVLGSAEEFGTALFAVVVSTCPRSLDCPECGRLHIDQPAVWRHYCGNTLRRLREQMAGPAAAGSAGSAESHVAQFAAIYRRVLSERAGPRVLDVGSSLGFLPVLLAESAPEVTAVGCDNRADVVAVGSDVAAAEGCDRTRFVPGDVLSPSFAALGRFDTVVSVHLLEHLSESELPAALSAMLAAATRRLIVSVPYEAVVEPLYGHRQAFTPEKLRRWGEWCVTRAGGGAFRCEDVQGGLLLVDLP